jgi:hypothetical protein
VIGLERLPRFAKLIEHIFGQRELVPPGFILEVEHAEWQLVGGTRRWSSGSLFIAAGGAGTNAKVEVLNPINSGMLVVILGAKCISKPTGGVVRFVTDGAALGAPAPCIAMDERVPVGAAAQRNVQTQTRIGNAGALSGQILDRANVPAGGDQSFSIVAANSVVIPPGQTAGIQNETVNEQLNAFFWGYERPALPEELGAV